MLISSRFCLVIIIVAVHDVMGMSVLEDLVEIDSLILDLEDRDYATAANACERLKRTCSHNWEAFTYVQERTYDVRISERARNKMHEIITSIWIRVEVNQLHGIW